MTHGPRPDDHELEQYLKGGSDLSRHYRDASREKAPAELDEPVLALARAEARRKPSLNRLLAPVALAASLVLAVNLVWNLREQSVPGSTPEELDRLGEENVAPAATPAAQAQPEATAEAPRSNKPAAPSPPAAKRREAPRRDAEIAASTDSGAAGAMAAYESKDEAVAEKSAEAVRESSERMNLVAKEQQQALTSRAPEGLVAAKEKTERKHGWWLTGSASSDYGIGLANYRPHSGNNSLVITSKRTPPPRGFGALMHRIPAAPFRGHPVLFEAWLRAEAVADWAGLWLRLDDANGQMLRLDNMHDRPIRGEQDWQPRYIILDVPEEAEWINFGVTLQGTGRVWIDTARIEKLSSDDTADTASARFYDFEERQLER